MSDEQAVTDKPNTEPKASGEGQGALDDLDSTLKEWDQQAKPTPAAPVAEPQSGPDDDPLRSWAQQKMVEEQQQQTQADISQAVSQIRDGLDVKAPEIAVKGILYSTVEESPAAMGIWQARKTDPTSWNRLLDGVKAKVEKEFQSLPDEKLTDDRDVVTAAVHSASNHSPQEKEVDVSTMSDMEFANYKMALERQSRK